MYAVVWAIKKFEYELHGKRFLLVTDHKALTEINGKGISTIKSKQVDRLNRRV